MSEVTAGLAEICKQLGITSVPPDDIIVEVIQSNTTHYGVYVFIYALAIALIVWTMKWSFKRKKRKLYAAVFIIGAVALIGCGSGLVSSFMHLIQWLISPTLQAIEYLTPIISAGG